ncbi:MAG TPA: matrixin family metalloprotease [Thermoplasmatales archaeon]|nr:matrixin family metalloprotease [Thermoplasmatales archaeon]
MRKVSVKTFTYLFGIFLLFYFSFSFADEITNHPPNKPSLVSPVNNATGVNVIVNLSCYVTDIDNDTMSVKFYFINISFEGEYTVNITNISFHWVNESIIDVYNLTDYTLESKLIGIVYDVMNDSIVTIGPVHLEYNKTYYWYAIVNDTEYENASEIWRFTTEANHPPDKPFLEGIEYGYAGIIYNFSISSTDQDGDKIRYGFDWNGDGSIDEWTDYYASEVTINISHSWNETGIYYLSVIAQDENGMKSLPYEMVIQINKSENALPFCSLEINNSHGYIPFNITFFISASDEDGYISSWSLDVDNDGITEYDGNGSPPAQIWYVYNDTGNFTAKLTVIDNGGAMGFAEVSIYVYLLPPPEILDVLPKELSPGDVLNITIIGRNFVNDTTILTESPFVNIIHVWFIDNETIVARVSVNENATGKINVTAVNPDGQKYTTEMLIKENVEGIKVLYYLIIITLGIIAVIAFILIKRRRQLLAYYKPKKEIFYQQIPRGTEKKCKEWKYVCLRFFAIDECDKKNGSSELLKGVKYNNKGFGELSKEAKEKILKLLRNVSKIWEEHCCIKLIPCRDKDGKPILKAINPNKIRVELEYESGIKKDIRFYPLKYIQYVELCKLLDGRKLTGENGMKKSKVEIKLEFKSTERMKIVEAGSEISIEDYKKWAKDTKHKIEINKDKKEVETYIDLFYLFNSVADKEYKERCINVFIFENYEDKSKAEDIAGYARVGKRGIFLDESVILKNQEKVLAHEIGHNLGLEHHSDKNNLMHKKVYNTKLERDQCKKAVQNIEKVMKKPCSSEEINRYEKEEKKKSKEKQKKKEKKNKKEAVENKVKDELKKLLKKTEKKVHETKKKLQGEIEMLKKKIEKKEKFIRNNYVKAMRKRLIEMGVEEEDVQDENPAKWKWPKEWDDEYLSGIRSGYEKQMKELEKLRETQKSSE